MRGREEDRVSICQARPGIDRGLIPECALNGQRDGRGVVIDLGVRRDELLQRETDII